MPASEAVTAPKAATRSWERAIPWILALGVGALYLWRLSTMALWDNDETTYAEIAREMIRSGDYVTLHFRGLPWFCHPPLYFWLVTVLDRVLGAVELAARLPAALAGTALVVVTYLWGLRTVGRRAALWGAVCLALNFQIYTESRMALLDTLLHVFCFLSLYGLWLGLEGDRRGYVLMFVASGLACLSKGPFGLVFPWLVALPYLAWTKQLRRLREIPWAWALAALLLGGTWYAVEIALHGRFFFDTVLVYFAVKRMTVRVQGQGGPVWLYLAIMGAGLFPWSVYLPAALMRAWRERSRATDLLLVSVVVPFLFFTAAETKLPNYIVFAYPGACLLVGWYLDRLVAGGQVRRATVATLVACGVGAAFVYGLFQAAPRYPQYAPAFPVAEAICAFFAVCTAVGVWACLRPGGSGPLKPLAVGAALFLFACATWLAPVAEPFRPIKPLGEAARDRLSAQDTLAMYGLTGEYGLTFYARHLVLPVRNEQELRRVFNSRGKVLAVLSEQAFQSLRASDALPVYCIATHGQAVLVSNQPAPPLQG